MTQEGTNITIIDPEVERSIKEALNGIVPQAIGLTFQLDVTVFDDGWSASDISQLNHGAEIHILGDWLGSVVLRFSEPFALHLVESLFGDSCNSLQDVRVDEVIRELVNMIGGNLKSLLGESCILSVPKSHLNSTYKGDVLGARQWLSGLYEVNGHKLHVAIWANEKSPLEDLA